MITGSKRNLAMQSSKSLNGAGAVAGSRAASNVNLAVAPDALSTSAHGDAADSNDTPGPLTTPSHLNGGSESNARYSAPVVNVDASIDPTIDEELLRVSLRNWRLSDTMLPALTLSASACSVVTHLTYAGTY